MATALVDENINDDTPSTSNKKTSINYPGPNPDVRYPLTVLYCGGKLIERNKSFKLRRKINNR